MASVLLQPDILAQAEALGLAAREVVEGLRVGDHKSPYRGFSVEFVQHREYVPGDDIKHIDWKSYARSDRYTLKQYEQETNFVGHILVDGSRSMKYGEGQQNKLSYAKVLAASLAYIIIHQRDSAALRIFDSDWRAELPPGSQLGHVQTICRTLEAIEPREKTSIGPLLEQLAERVSRRGIIFLISDGFDEVESLIKGLRHLRFRGHEVILFHVLHADELDFPLDGNIRFQDLEGPEELMTRPHLLRPAYLRALQSYLQQLRHDCDTSRVEYVLMRTDRPIKSSLGAYLISRLQAAAR